MDEKLNALKKELVDNVDNFVTEQAKEAVVTWLKESGIPTLKEIADVYVEKLKQDAATENGWNKFRDGIVLPCLCDVTFYVVGKILSH